MLSRGRIGVCALAALALALAPAAAEAGDPIEVLVAKHAGGPFETGEPSVNINAGDSKNLYIRTPNNTGQALSLTLTELISPDQAHYRLEWFKGKHEITSDVQGSGFEFNLKVGAKKTFRLHVKAKQSPDEACVGGRFDASGHPPGFGLFELNAAPGFCSG